MPYFKNDDVNILFIHIPKTGGSSIEAYLSEKYNIQLNEKSLYMFMDNEKMIKENISINSSLQHMTYNQIVEYNRVFNIDFNNIKIFAVVRNPYKRIISDLFYFKLIKPHYSKRNTFNIIKQYLVSNDYDNHNIPQHLFVTNDKKEIIPNINVLKTEQLKDDMQKIGFTDFNTYIFTNQHKVNYYNYFLN
jgi:hypothetical protein